MPVCAVLARNATEVRQNFREFLDEVLHDRPQAITRYDDVVMALSLQHLEALLEHISFTMEYEKESDMSVSGSIIELPLCENAGSVEELKAILADAMVAYAGTYLAEFKRCFNSPGLDKQLPYILKIYIQPDLEAVMQLIHG